jgi:CubicO group peptidase (beta-lactamase class C family)
VLLFLLWSPVQGAKLADDPKIAAAIRMLEAWIESDLAYKGKPGLSIGIVHDQELIWARGFGYADVEKRIPTTTETAYRMASNTKMFTAISLMKLRDAGKLELHDPVTKHLPWFQPKGMEKNPRPITIWNLLTHTSGLPREAAAPYWTDNEFPSPQEFRELIRTQEVIYRPEKRWKYSNLALSLGGEIVEAVSGEPYAEYVQRHILQPLGMTGSAIGISSAVAPKMAVGYGRRMPDGSRDIRPASDCKAIDPAAGLVSTLEDMARFAMLQFREDDTDGEQVLSATTLNEMHRVRWLQPDWKRGWGIGFSIWREGETTLVGHGGSLAGYRTQTAFSPADKIAVLVLTNSDDGDAGGAAGQAFKLVAPAIKKATEKEEEKEFDPTWSRYAGLYRNPWGDTQVMVGHRELLMFSPLASDLSQGVGKLIPVEEGVFRLESKSGGPAVGELIQFEINGSGEVTRIKIGDNYSRRLGPDER